MNKLPILLVFFLIYSQIEVFSQDTTQSRLGVGVRYSFFYNYKVAHHIPCLSLDIRQHNIYLGAQATTILKPLGDPVDIYEKNAYGINVGYRYLLVDSHKRLVPFTQLNFSIYQVKYTKYQKGPPFSTPSQTRIVENTASFGIDFKPIKHIHIFSGIGFGSFGGFLLLIDYFTPNSYVGLEYKF